MSFPFLGAFAMTFIAVGILPWFGILLKFSPIYKLVSSLLPQGGTGPSREAIAKGSYEMELIGTAETEPYENPIRVRGIVRGMRGSDCTGCKTVSLLTLRDNRTKGSWIW